MEQPRTQSFPEFLKKKVGIQTQSTIDKLQDLASKSHHLFKYTVIFKSIDYTIYKVEDGITLMIGSSLGQFSYHNALFIMGYIMPQGNDVYMFDCPLEVLDNGGKHHYDVVEDVTTPEEDREYREDLFDKLLDGLRATR